MTERLYYDDAYLTEFDARVTGCTLSDGVWRVYLDRSAFYPTSGGQPFDTGALGAARVLDVCVDESHDVCHVTDRPLEVGTAVHGKIDWARRFDHMQQHAADHMIASALWRLMGGVTIGLHISDEVSTIDVAMPEGTTHLAAQDIARIEQDVNERIQRDVPVRCWFPDADELRRLPLRKPPTVSEHVRVVAIGADEMVACGGTHPAAAGQLGLVKIVGAAPARGKLRVSFLAGMRAFWDYQRHYDCARAAAASLSTSVDCLPEQVSAMQESLKKAGQALGRLRREAALQLLEQEAEAAPRLPDGARVIARMMEGDIQLLKDAASHLIRRPGRIVLLGAESEAGRAAFVFARSGDVGIHMGRLLSEAASSLGGKGGGRPDFAQGGGPAGILEAAKALLTEQA